MKKMLAVLAVTLPLGLAYAQTRNAEAYPVTNSKAQQDAEKHRAQRKPGVAPIKDGSSAEGQGSGVDKVTGTEKAGDKRRDEREARLHVERKQGGTPD